MRFKFWKTCSLISLVFSLNAFAQEEELTAEEAATPAESAAPETPAAETAKEEVKSEEQAAPEVAPAAAEPELKFKSTAEIVRERDANRVAREQRIFGKYDITLAMNRPKFTQQENVYRKFYGSPSDYFSLGVDWYPIDWFATIGFGVKAGFYSDAGKTSSNRKSPDDPDAEQVVIKEDSSTNLTTFPLQVLAKIQATPFRKKYIKLAGWGGYERNYWRETKKIATDESTTSTSTEAQQPLSSSGSKDAIVIGGAVHFLLNFLDETSVNSMQGSMGLGFVYLTPYFEMIKQRTNEGINLSRNVLGLGFTFESLR